MASAIWLHGLFLAFAGASCTDSHACLKEDQLSLLSLVQVNVKTQQLVSMAPDQDYYWSSRGGSPRTNSFAPYTARSDFSEGPTWVWQNELKEQVRHSPLIDADLNIYVCTTTRLRKFDSDGILLWTWHAAPTQMISAAPALYKGSVYVLPRENADGRPSAVSIDMRSGTVHWERAYDGVRQGADAEAINVDSGMLWFGAATAVGDGTDTVVAASASDGSMLWKYVTDHVMWNFSPSTPGDGTLLFSSQCGTVFRISSEGKLMWKAGRNHQYDECVPAGGALGPNGIFYSEFNEGAGSMLQSQGATNNTLAAYNVTDGSLVWERNLPYRAAQYPAVGKLGPDGPLAVVAPLGDNPMPPRPFIEDFLLAGNGGAERNMVMALDAGTGATIWISEEAPFSHMVAAGEFDEHNATDGSICLSLSLKVM